MRTFKALLYIFGSALLFMLLVAAVLYFTESDFTVIVVPLDSRPVNTQHLKLLGKIGGIEVLLPPADVMDSFTHPADVESIMRWLREMSSQADCFIIHTNTVIAGGLIASRHPASYQHWEERLQELTEFLKGQSEKEVYCISVMPRLLPTQFDNHGWHYRAQLTEYAQLVDKLSRGEGSPTDERRLEELEVVLPTAVLNSYLEVYRIDRKINEELLELVRQSAVDHLVLTLDDGAEYGLSNLNQRELVQAAEKIGLGGKVHVLQGADEIDMLTLARLAVERYACSPVFALVYESDGDRELLLPYEVAPLDALVKAKIAYIGGRVEAQASNVLYLHTRPGFGNADAVAAAVAAAGSRGQLGIIDIAYINRGDKAFVTRLVEEIPVQRIDSYGGWNTAGNSAGSVIAHLALKYAAWGNGRFASKRLVNALAADIEYRFLHLADAVCYLGDVKSDLVKWACGNGIDPYNFNSRQLPQAEMRLRDTLNPKLQQLKEHFLGSWQFKIGHSIVEVELMELQWQVELPWTRLFEVRVIPRAILAEQ